VGVHRQRGDDVAETRFGPYRLVAPLGRGGMGEVWRAVDTSQGDRLVALKLLGSWLGDDPDYARRFRRESGMAARLTSPHIVPIHRYGDVDGRLFIDMQLIAGTDLGALLGRGGPLPPARAVDVVAQTAKALDAAHRARLLHRDVKPTNILVCDDGDDDHTYLIDFGIARPLDGTRVSAATSVVGTLAYMAPERFAGREDHRSDVYALGCVLHQVLTGYTPFPATNPLALLGAHHHEVPPPPSAVRPGLPPQLDQVVGRALAKDPAYRFGSAGELARAARQALVAPAVRVHGPAPVAVGPQPTRFGPPQTFVAPAPFHGGHPAPGYHPTPPPPRRRRGWIAVPIAAVAAVGLVVAGVVVLGTPQGGSAGPVVTASPGPSTTAAPRPFGERSLTGHAEDVYGVAVAQLGGRPVVVSGSYDDSVRVWDLAAGSQVGSSMGQGADVEAVTVGELDGRPVAVSGGDDNNLRVWDLATHQQIGDPLTGHTGWVRSVVVTQLDGRPVIVSSADDNAVRVWDLATHAPVGEPMTGHTDWVRSLAVTQLDGRPVVVSASDDRSVRVWDLATHAPVGAPITGHTDWIRAVAVGELDGRPVIVSGADDRTVRVWDLATHAPVGAPLTGHTDNLGAVLVTQLDGRPVVVSGADDSTVRVWDLESHAPLGRPLRRHSGAVRALAATTVDGRAVLVSGSSDRSLRTWDLAAAVGS
jgi:eukaryotic-like serine/threonine-protein kinase